MKSCGARGGATGHLSLKNKLLTPQGNVGLSGELEGTRTDKRKECR